MTGTNQSTLSPSIGILLAAGRSRRMGQLKLTLAWPTPQGEATVIASAFDGLAPLVDAGIILVVTNEDHETALREALGDRTFTFAHAHGDAPMFESIRTALRTSLEENQSIAGIWLHPADHPIISPAVREILLAVAGRTPDQAVMPTFAGKGGHPVWIPRRWCERLVEESGDGGLRVIWERYPMEVQRVPVDDATCIIDLDTPEDYRIAIEQRGRWR